MQTRRMSAVEAATNTVVGFVLSWTIAMIAYPLCGIEASESQALAATAILTAVSTARSYALRRAFERIRKWKRKTGTEGR